MEQGCERSQALAGVVCLGMVGPEDIADQAGVTTIPDFTRRVH